MGENSAPVAYAAVNNQNSIEFCRAFTKGCNGRMAVTINTLFPGPVAGFWLPELYPILLQAQKLNRDWYYGDKAYFVRERYFRITKNAKMHGGHGEATPERFEKLGIPIKPWRSGDEILICPQSDVFFNLNGTTQQKWIDEVVTKLKKYTDRPIRVHYKRTTLDTEQFFRGQLHNAWAVVVYSSMAGVHAALAGVPCFATNTESTAVNFGTNDLSLIESPVKPDNREQMAWVLADNQWTLDEIRSGMAWEAIK